MHRRTLRPLSAATSTLATCTVRPMSAAVAERPVLLTALKVVPPPAPVRRRAFAVGAAETPLERAVRTFCEG